MPYNNTHVPESGAFAAEWFLHEPWCTELGTLSASVAVGPCMGQSSEAECER